MKILVTARHVVAGATSEGTCTVKFANLLADRGHDVICLNGDDSVPAGPLAWMPGCTMVALPGAVAAADADRDLSLVAQKLDAARTYATGFPRSQRAARRRWRDGLREAIAAHRPDVVFVRAAGQDFSPHLAMTDLASDDAGAVVPWVGHYHDPWPLSLYPEPYARREGTLPWLQERANRSILRAAGAVTFPSARLRDWESARSGVIVGDRGVVVPHQGVTPELVGPTGEPPVGDRSGPLTVVHAGYLNRQRDPQPLLDALIRRVARLDATGAPTDIRLRLVGALDPKLTATARWAEAVARLAPPGALVIDGQRVSYAESIAAVRAADVGLVVAVGRPESPFFPAKLADLVSLGGPLLVLAPSASTPADIVGTDHPGFADIDRPGDIDRALDALVEARRTGTLSRFSPPGVGGGPGLARPRGRRRRGRARPGPRRGGSAVSHPTPHRILVVAGTRPEVIKVAPVVRALDEADGFEPVLCVTRQHDSLLDQAVAALDLMPDLDLDVFTPGASMTSVLATVIDRLGAVIAERAPDVVLVQGDTLSTFAGAVAGHYGGVAVAHLEAGLRSGLRNVPYPEEVNRRATTQIADIHLAPTEANRAALRAERVPDEDIFVTGNTGIDSLRWMLDHPAPPAPDVAALDLRGPVVLVTAHRRESWEGGLADVAQALAVLLERHPDVDIVLPAHANPAVRRRVRPAGGVGHPLPPHRPGRLPRPVPAAGGRHPGAHRQRRHPGGGAGPRSAGAGPA